VYPKLRLYARDADHPEDGGPIFADEMMALVGWEAETPENQFGGEYDLYDAYGTKVRLLNNGGNRYHEYDISERYAYEILNRNWAGPTCFPGETVNGESMDFSRTGLVKSGQHRGAGLILAKQLWERDNEKWRKNWPTEPCLETVLVVGVSDDARITRTYDTGRPRTGADTLYSSGRFDGEGETRSSRRQHTKVADKCIQHLWALTGAAKPGNTPHRTQTEIEKFFGDHPRIEEAVRFVVQNNETDVTTGEGRLVRYGPPGAVAAMLYLMGAGHSKRAKYKLLRSEAGIDFAHWDKAIDFWLTLAQGGLNAVREAAYPIEGDEWKKPEKWLRGKIFPTGKKSASPMVLKKAQLANGWFAFLARGAEGCTPARVRLKYYFERFPTGVLETDPETGAPVYADADKKTQRTVVGEGGYDSFEDVLFGGIEMQAREKDGSDGVIEDADDAADGPAKPPQPTTREMILNLNAQFPDEIVVVYATLDNPKTRKPDPSTSHYRAFGAAADELAKLFKIKYAPPMEGLNQVILSREEWILKKVPATLGATGRTVREVTKFDVDPDTGYYVVTESKVYKPTA
jgi:hypothetical protein